MGLANPHQIQRKSHLKLNDSNMVVNIHRCYGAFIATPVGLRYKFMLTLKRK